MPVYRKDRESWKVVVKRHGTRKDWIVHGTKKDAEAFEARKRLELEAADPELDPRVVPTFSDFCVTQDRPHAEVHLKASTWYKRSSLLSFVMEQFGSLKLTEIHARAIDDYKKRRRGRPQERLDQQRAAGAAIVLNFAARERKLPIADVHIRLLEETQRRVRAWTREEVDRLLAAVRDESPELLPIVVCLLNPGMRKGEALALTWPQVDVRGREIRIWPSDEWQPKDNEPREVPISDALLPFLTARRRSSTWVFPCGTGDRWSCWPKLQFDRARERVGLRGGPHTLRHTFASHFLARQPDIGLLAQVLGHSEESVTRLYQHMLPERLARARNVVSTGAGGARRPSVADHGAAAPSVNDLLGS